MSARTIPGIETWLADAACRGTATALFFPTTAAGVGPAEEVCAACPVRVECLEYAIATRQPDGVWGGLTSVERHRLLRRRQKAARKQRTANAA